jgi:uncharacterized protein YecT (DUF1311 family)
MLNKKLRKSGRFGSKLKSGGQAMRLFPGSSRRGKLHLTFVSAGLAVAALVLAALSASAQDPSAAPDQNQAQAAPAPAAFQHTIPGGQLAFIDAYAGKPAKELLKERQFQAILKQVTPRTEYHYGRDMPLSDARDAMLDGSKLPVEVREDRYVMVSGDKGPYLHGRGFMWIDVKDGIALGGVYFHPTNGEPTPTLAIYSRQLKDTALTMTQLPLAFAEDLSRFVQAEGLRFVSTRYFIPENGKKYVLMHDEDYCDHPADRPAPPQDTCEALNVEAADADLNAADFMEQTHNAANATAWMLSPNTLAWLDVRNQSCGAGPGFGVCRVRLTRQRVRVLVSQQR